MTPRPAAALALAPIALACPPRAFAEHADRTKQIAVSADYAVADQAHHTAKFSGDVVVNQGTLEIHADPLTMREGARGERLGVAFGRAGAPVRFRQRGDRPGERNEAQADRVEYDSTANEVRLIGAALLRNLDGTAVTQSVASDAITCDTARDRVSSTGADLAASTLGRPARRVTVIFEPRVPAPDYSGTATPSP